MGPVRNILFVMADQLRADHLSCYGHRTLATPNIDALAVTGPKRIAALPQVPTLLELGFKDLVVRDWQGLMVRAGTPPEVVARLNAAIAVALADPDVQQQLAKAGVDTAGGTPAQLAALVDSEVKRWAEVVKRQGLKAD